MDVKMEFEGNEEALNELWKDLKKHTVEISKAHEVILKEMDKKIYKLDDNQ